VEHRADGSVDVGGVHSGKRVTQVGGNAVGQARREPKHPAFASASGKTALVKSGDRGRPVDRGHKGSAVSDTRFDVDIAVAEVVPVEPGCAGHYAAEAATGLIIAHSTWLDRHHFARFIHHDPGTAVIDWEAAIGALDVGELPNSAGEKRMLRLAANLAGQAPVSLAGGRREFPGSRDEARHHRHLPGMM